MHPSSSPTSYTFRRATEKDIDTLTAIETNAASIFKDIPELADLGGSHVAVETIHDWLSNGRVYIAEDNGTPAGFVAAIPRDTAVYVAEVSTLPAYQGKGVGTALLGLVMDWARERAASTDDRPRVSLTTYREVSWNAPWYRKLGFKEVEPETIGPKHVQKVRYDREERNLERNGYTRCCMLWEGE